MGLWSGWNPSIQTEDDDFLDLTQGPSSVAQLRAQEQSQRREQRILREVRQARGPQQRLRRGAERGSQASFEVGRQVGEFGAAALEQQRQDFSREQMALKSLFGGGDKIWGINRTPVMLNHDLNPSQRGDMGTARLFGF